MNLAGTRLTRTFAVALTIFGAVAIPLGTAPLAAAAGTASGLAKSYTGSAKNLTAAESGPINLSGVTQTGGAISGTFAFHAPLTGTGPSPGRLRAVTFPSR